MRTLTAVSALLSLAAGLPAGEAAAQAALADDILAAISGGGGARGVQPQPVPATLAAEPASEAPIFRASPGGENLLFGGAPLVFPGGGAVPLEDPTAQEPALAERGGVTERATPLPQFAQAAQPPQIFPPALPAELPSPELRALADEDFEGPPDGISLEEAIDRVVRHSPDLRTKYYEIPIAEADLLTASLRSNPLFFYASSGIPYGDYTVDKPGSISHAATLTIPVDITGKRSARIAVAQAAKKVIAAQYQDAVRLEIEQLHGAWIDVLEARQGLRFAETTLAWLEEVLERARGDAGKPQGDLAGLRIQIETTRLLVETERSRLQRARQVLAGILALPPEEACCFEIQGSLRVPAPPLPPAEELVDLAMENRADLIAAQLGVQRAVEDIDLAEAGWIGTPFLLVTPFAHAHHPAEGIEDSTSWSVGVFLPLPLFNRNQGNIRRAVLSKSQAESQVRDLELRIRTQVSNAAEAVEHSSRDIARIGLEILPDVEQQLEETYQQFVDGKIGVGRYLQTLRDYTSMVRLYRTTLVRHRQNMLNLNTVVGLRLLP